jgi:hypothetical protein
MAESGLFVASAQGLWYYTLGAEVVESEYVVDPSSTWALALASGALMSSGPLVPGFPAGLVKLFRQESQTGTYQFSTGLAIQPHSAYLSSCMGRIMAYDPPYLVMADPCWSTTGAIPVNGMIKSFIVDEVADTILVDATEGAYGGYWPFGEGVFLGEEFGRTLCLKGDTLFIGFGPAMSGGPAHVEVMRRAPSGGWERYKQVHVPADWSGPAIGDLGRAIVADGDDLIIGTDHGLAFYHQVDTGWVMQHFEPLGGAVYSISLDGDRMAVAVPGMGHVLIYERNATSVEEGAEVIRNLRIAPNPAHRHTQVLPIPDALGARELLITDAMGRVLERMAWDGRHPLELMHEGQPDGIRFLHILDGNGRQVGIGRMVWLTGNM